jgi:hypothetical protein
MTMDSQQYANLSDHSYGRDQRGNTKIDLGGLVGKTVAMADGERYKILAHVDKPSGYQGTIYQRENTGEIVVAHRGTEFGREPLQDGVLTDGGMVFTRANQQAQDAIDLTRSALDSARESSKALGVARPEVTVTGHSLGGTLAQITSHHFDLRGEAFNPYGAVSLNHRIPEQATPRMVNHVMAADLVSAASPHYGQVRIYASAREIGKLQASGYHNNRALDLVTPDRSLAASVNTSHMMHNFLNVDGDYRRDVSALGDAAMRTRAADNARMIGRYREDVAELRTGATLAGDAVGIIKDGPLLMPRNAYEHLRERLREPLPAGEPARLEEEKRRRGASPETGERPLAPDMRDPAHPAHARYFQLHSGIVEIDRAMGRTPDASSERLAAALTAASARMPSVGTVSLSQDGTRAFVVDASDGPAQARDRAHVDVSKALQQPVEASTAQWQAASERQGRQQVEWQAQALANPALEAQMRMRH